MSVRYRVTAAPQASGYSEAGASYKRRALRAFFPNSNSPSSDIHDNADILRQRSRMLYMSAPVATSAINTNRTKSGRVKPRQSSGFGPKTAAVVMPWG